MSVARFVPLWICLAMALTACGQLPIPGKCVELYALDDVRVRAASRSQDGAACFEYFVLAETLYYCGGAKVRRSGDDAYVSLVRAPVGVEYHGASVGTGNGDDGWFAVVIPDVRGALLIDDGTATKELLPKATELP